MPLLSNFIMPLPYFVALFDPALLPKWTSWSARVELLERAISLYFAGVELQEFMIPAFFTPASFPDSFGHIHMPSLSNSANFGHSFPKTNACVGPRLSFPGLESS